MRRLWAVSALSSILAFLACGGGGQAHPDAANTGGTDGGACVAGHAGCPCYPNDTCDAALVCTEHRCSASQDASIDLAWTPEGGTDVPVGTGGAAAGGMTGQAGAGGVSATGGSTGGTSTGGTSTGGLTTGGGGAAGAGGTTGGAASGGAAGGVAGTVGGAAGTVGGASGNLGGAGGQALSPYLTFNAGFVAKSSNAFAIEGPLYTFADDVGSTISPICSPATAACFKSLNNTGKFCVHGVGTDVLLNSSGTDYDYLTYWGAAVALDLNLPPAGTRGPYVASAHGLTGFSFELTNQINLGVPTGPIRFSYGVPNGASGFSSYCVQPLVSGKNTIYFSSSRLNCYTTGGTPLGTAGSDNLYLLQWQVPTTALEARSFDFCIDKITPLTD